MNTRPETVPCPNCAYPIPAQVEYCPECGARAEGEDDGSQDAAEAPLDVGIAPEAYAVAAELMKNGVSEEQLQSTLAEKGIDPPSAAAVVAHFTRLRSEAMREAGKKNMFIGALWCIGGLVVTAVTYGAASSAGGGRYVIAWGAVVFGAIQFMRGLIQSGGK